MAEGLSVKEIRCSLEVVAVFADHPLKIKLDTCFRIRENNEVYKLSIEYARTSHWLPSPLFI
jgi:hypothetical protein